MATKPSSSLLSLFLLAILPYYQFVRSNPTGFSLKLVATDSPPNNPRFLNIIRPHITRLAYRVTIDGIIGTPGIKQNFIFDTASPLTWTQCSPCIKCFSQTLPVYDPKKSSSYEKMNQSHKLHNIFNVSTNGNLVYKAEYASGQSSSGIPSLETFTFPSDKRTAESIKEIVFGCGNNNLGSWPSTVTGIMGMDRSPLSLISQMGVKKVKRFSYCLPKSSSSIKTTFLRFGTDVKTRSGLQKLKLFEGYKYRVNLQGISVGGKRLKLPKDTFSNGCLLDTGHPGSRLDTRAYNEVVKVLTEHFDKSKLTRLRGGDYEGQLCYKMKPGFKNFPNMTLHFKGGVGCFNCRGVDMKLGYENVFGFQDDIFCMTIYETKNAAILGAFQMQDVRFVYDLVQGNVALGAENCELDKA